MMRFEDPIANKMVSDPSRACRNIFGPYFAMVSQEMHTLWVIPEVKQNNMIMDGWENLTPCIDCSAHHRPIIAILMEWRVNI